MRRYHVALQGSVPSCRASTFFENIHLTCQYLLRVSRSVLSLCDPMDYIARQSSLSMGFSSQEYWSGLPCPPSGDLPNPEIEPRSPTLQENSLLSEPPGKAKNTGVSRLALLRESSQPRNWIQISFITGGFFTSWATREVSYMPYNPPPQKKR